MTKDSDYMGIFELFESGFFSPFWDWSSPILTGLYYFGVIIGAILQIFLQKKFRNPIIKWLLMGICGIGIIICECWWRNTTGWDRLTVDIVYALIICFLLGAIIATVISLFVKGKR